MTYKLYASLASDTFFDGIESIRPAHTLLGNIIEFNGWDRAFFRRAANTEKPEETDFPDMRVVSQQVAASKKVFRYQLIQVRCQDLTHELSHLPRTVTVIIFLIHRKHLGDYSALRLIQT